MKIPQHSRRHLFLAFCGHLYLFFLVNLDFSGCQGVTTVLFLMLLSQAYERRFPKCHLIPMFVASDVVSEETTEDGSTHKVERRCALDVDAPRLLKRVRGAQI